MKNHAIPSKKEYEVEKVIGKKICGSQVLYKIKWKNYSMSNSTWEPLSNLSNSKELVMEYESFAKAKIKTEAQDSKMAQLLSEKRNKNEHCNMVNERKKTKSKQPIDKISKESVKRYQENNESQKEPRKYIFTSQENSIDLTGISKKENTLSRSRSSSASFNQKKDQKKKIARKSSASSVENDNKHDIIKKMPIANRFGESQSINNKLQEFNQTKKKDPHEESQKGIWNQFDGQKIKPLIKQGKPMENKESKQFNKPEMLEISKAYKKDDNDWANSITNLCDISNNTNNDLDDEEIQDYIEITQETKPKIDKDLTKPSNEINPNKAKTFFRITEIEAFGNDIVALLKEEDCNKQLITEKVVNISDLRLTNPSVIVDYFINEFIQKQSKSTVNFK